MRSSIFFRLVRTPQWRCLRTTRQRWPSCGIRGAPEPRFSGRTAHDLLRWAERHSTSLLPQFIMGLNTVLANFVLSSQFNSGFRVDPETVSVSAASEKAAGVTRPVRILIRCYLIFLRSTVPMLLGQRFFSNQGMGGRRMLFLPMCLFLRFCKLLRSSSGVLLTIIAPY